MANVRKNHTMEFKTKVAVEAIRQQKTINELTTEYGVHGNGTAVLPGACMGRVPGVAYNELNLEQNII
ncbi:MAG: hypothetical protein CTY16_14085 [Methylobacter sp.]|nr:MAG: hypothetical protein CTY16_14085 [Methylobacter sp.]